MSFINESFILEIIDKLRPLIEKSELYKKIKELESIKNMDISKIETLKELINKNKFLIEDEFEYGTYKYIKNHSDKQIGEYLSKLITQEINTENFINQRDIFFNFYYYIIMEPDEFNENFGNFGLIRISKLEIDYFSAYPSKMSIDSFSSKNIIWLTNQISQSLLHPFDSKDFMDPVLFKFNLGRTIIVLNSNDSTNYNIFDKIDKEIISTFINFINLKDKINYESDEIFAESRNNYILYIIEAINRILNTNLLKIDGYQNKYDQNEIALIHFNDIVNKQSIKKYNFTKIVFNKKQIILPLDSKKNFQQIFGDNAPSGFYNRNNFNYSKIYKLMMCNDIDMQIYYQIEDKSESENSFDCLTLSKESYYFKKYLKYKQKYLELKKNY